MNKLENNFLEITGIIDASAGLVLGALGEEVSASKNKQGKDRRLDTVLFFLTTYRKREGGGNAENAKPMSLAERLRMEAYMKAKGAEQVDYSVAKNAIVFEMPKAGFEALVGSPYEGFDLSTLVGKDANVEFSAFVETPHRVRTEDILASEYANLSDTEKLNYDEKTAGTDGVKLTHAGEQIFRGTFLDEVSWGIEDVILAHEQDLSLENQKATATAGAVKA